MGAAWDFSGCSPPDGLTYEECALLTGVGSIRSEVDLLCGESDITTFQVGDANPAFDGTECDQGPPLAGNAARSKDLQLTCGGC